MHVSTVVHGIRSAKPLSLEFRLAGESQASFAFDWFYFGGRSLLLGTLNAPPFKHVIYTSIMSD